MNWIKREIKWIIYKLNRLISKIEFKTASNSL